jgi:hypothetical protein
MLEKILHRACEKEGPILTRDIRESSREGKKVQEQRNKEIDESLNNYFKNYLFSRPEILETDWQANKAVWITCFIILGSVWEATKSSQTFRYWKVFPDACIGTGDMTNRAWSSDIFCLGGQIVNLSVGLKINYKKRIIFTTCSLLAAIVLQY